MSKRILEQTRIAILTQGWEFNKREITLAVNANGRVPVSADYLDVILKKDNTAKNYAVQPDTEDGTLYIWNFTLNDWHAEDIEEVDIIFDVSDRDQFRLLPERLARYIAHRAAADYWTETHDGTVSPKLEAQAARMETLWVNSQRFQNLDEESGYNALRAHGFGGTTRTYDPRTQTSN